jgi:hypothetical protein
VSVLLPLLFGASCAATSSTGTRGEAALVSPAELFASLADAAQGRNADLAETGLTLKTIELRLVVGYERRAGARASFLVLDVEASRTTDVSFTEAFTFEVPPPERRRSAAPRVEVPGVAEFVDAAIATARELAAAAEREGIPQRLSELDLTAKIVRSTRVAGGVGFTGLVAGASAAGAVRRAADETNVVRLLFRARP